MRDCQLTTKFTRRTSSRLHLKKIAVVMHYHMRAMMALIFDPEAVKVILAVAQFLRLILSEVA